MEQYSTQEYVCGSILVTTATVSLCCMLINLYLIYDLNLWNGHTLLVYVLTIFQCLYDFSFYFLLGFRSTAVFAIYKFLANFCGTFISLWINFISLILYYTIFFLESFDIKRHYWKVALCIFFVSLFLATMIDAYYIFDNGNNNAELVFYWLKIGSIAFNLILYFLTYFQLYGDYYSSFSAQQFFLQPRIASKSVAHLSSVAGKATNINYYALLRVQTRDLLLVLASRLKYYPIVQITSLACSAWWEYQYGFETTSFDNGDFSLQKEASLYLFTLFSPTAGIGFFIVFLMVQPLAYERLQKRWKEIGGYRCCLCCLKLCCRLDYKREKGITLEHSVESLDPEISQLTTKGLFLAASTRPIEAVNTSTPSSPIKLLKSERNETPSVGNPLILSISPDFNLEEYRKKLSPSAVEAIRVSTQMNGERESDEPTISCGQRNTSDEFQSRTITKSSIGGGYLFSTKPIQEKEDNKDNEEEEEEEEYESNKDEEQSITKSDTVTHPSREISREISKESSSRGFPSTDSHGSKKKDFRGENRVASKSTARGSQISQFAIEKDRSSHPQKLETMTEEMLWEEFEKRKKEKLLEIQIRQQQLSLQSKTPTHSKDDQRPDEV